VLKSNYKAWHIDSGDFSHEWVDDKKLEFFARYAVLAPSGHNTQPWELEIKGDTLLVSINKSRRLTADGSGLLSAEPYISVGTFLEMFALAAKGLGYSIKMDTLPDNVLVAKLRIEKRITPEPGILTAIVKRVSNRNPYADKRLDSKFLRTLTKADLTGISFTVINDKAGIDFMSQQTEKAIASIMSKPEYRKELSAWVRSNLTRKYDGMPGFTHGFGTVKSLISKAAIKHAPTQGPEAAKSAELIRKSGALIVVGCEDNSAQSFINAGRMFTRIFVLTYMAGLAASALGAAVLDSSTRKEVKKHFRISYRPLYVIRIGDPTKSSLHSPRWPLERVLKKTAA